MFSKTSCKRLSVFATLSLLTSLFAPLISVQAAQEPTAEPSLQATPIVATVPLAGATKVRPDTTLEWQFDKTDPHFNDWNKKLTKGDITLELLNDGGEAVFAGTDPEFTYDSTQGKLTFTPPALLNRYTKYGVILTLAHADTSVLQQSNRTTLPQEPAFQIQAQNVDDLLQTDESHPYTQDLTTTPHTVPPLLQPSASTLANLNKLDQLTQSHAMRKQPTKPGEFVGPTPVQATNGSLHPIDFKEGGEQKGIIEQIDSSVVTLFGGRQFTVSDATHIHLEQSPGPHTLADLHPGDAVVLTLNEQSVVQNINVKHNPSTSSFVFETGSDLHEPTHVSVLQQDSHPRVTEDGHFTLVEADDYGLPAWGSTTQITLATNDSTTLSDTSQVLPDSSFTTTATSGQTDVTVVDHVPQALVAKISMNGPYLDGQDAHGLVVFFNFRPGLPAQATLQAPDTMEVASVAELLGHVEDIYGNVVEDGTPIHLQATAGTVGSPLYTVQGEIHAGYTAPTRVQDVTVTLTSAVGQASASRTIHLLPGAPAQVTLQAQQQSLHTGDSTAVSGQVADQYGNPIAYQEVALQALYGILTPAEPQTDGTGWFTSTYTAPFDNGTDTITAQAGAATATLGLNISSEGYGQDPTTGRVEPVAALVFDQTAYQVAPNQQLKLTVRAYDADHNPLQNVVFAAPTVSGGTVIAFCTQTDATGSCPVLYQAPSTSGTATLTVSTSQVTAQATITVAASNGSPGPGYGYDPTTGTWVPVATLLFNPAEYSVLTGSAVTLTGSAFSADGHPLSMAKLQLTTDGGSTASQVVTKTDGTFSLLYAAPNTPGTYHVRVFTDAASSVAVVHVEAPAVPHLENSYINLSGTGSGNYWSGTLNWGTKVLNADGSPAPNLLFVVDDSYMDILDYNFTDATGTVTGGPMQYITSASYIGYSNGKLIHYATITFHISHFDIDQWAYIPPSYAKTMTVTW